MTARGAPSAPPSTGLDARPRLRCRVSVALGVAVAAGLIAAHVLWSSGNPDNAGDFTWYWRAARALLDGESPYAAINPVGPYPYNAGFLYPLPLAVMAVPFAFLPMQTAMVAFSAVAAGLLAFVITREGYWRLPLLMSFPMLWCAQSGQWAPLAVAGLLAPSLGGLAIAKPTLGLAALAFAPRRSMVLSMAVMALLSFAVLPGWLGEYAAEVSVRTTAHYQVPLFVVPGPLLIAALLRWRRPEARLLVAMACVPQTMLFYDQLPLAVIARSFRQALVFGLLSYLPIAILYFVPPPPDDTVASTVAITSVVIVCAYYLPCLVAVLLRPNAGRVPEPVERFIAGWPSWLRGQRAEPRTGAA